MNPEHFELIAAGCCALGHAGFPLQAEILQRGQRGNGCLRMPAPAVCRECGQYRVGLIPHFPGSLLHARAGVGWQAGVRAQRQRDRGNGDAGLEGHVTLCDRPPQA